MARRGKPSLLTPEVKKRFIEAVKAGSHYQPACAYAGIDYTTFRQWMQRGQGTHSTRSADKIYVDFVDEVLEAEAQGEISAIAAIKGASKEDWRAAAWSLERRHPDRWANTQKVRVLVDQQVESELNMLFEAIASNPNIPQDAKLEIFKTASSIQDRAAVAGQN